MFAIKSVRERAGLTQQEVADYLGIKKGRYGDWERETREINLRDAVTLADLFECTLDELAGRDFSPPGLGDAPVSQGEGRVVALYRSTDERGQAAILAVAESQRGAAQLPGDASPGALSA